jgi:prolyl-tRNA synthetase
VQVVIVPILYGEKDTDAILAKTKQIREALAAESIKVVVDDRQEYTPGYKFNDWEMKGVPLRIEIGPRDLKEGKVVAARRDTGEKSAIGDAQVQARIRELLQEIQDGLYNKARELLDKNIHAADDYARFKDIISKGGFVKTSWCGGAECELKIKEETGADIRAIPFDGKPSSSCIYCGKQAKHAAYFGRAY